MKISSIFVAFLENMNFNNEFAGNGGPPREGGDRGGNFERPNRSEESGRGGDNRLWVENSESVNLKYLTMYNNKIPQPYF